MGEVVDVGVSGRIGLLPRQGRNPSNRGGLEFSNPNQVQLGLGNLLGILQDLCFLLSTVSFGNAVFLVRHGIV